MLAVAVLAGLFAAFGIAVAIAIGGISLPILMAAPGRRLRAMIGVASVYPFLILSALYATWFTAWCILGHRPRVALDDPFSISPIIDVMIWAPHILLFGAPLIGFIYAPLIITGVYWNMAQRRTPPRKGAEQLLIPAFAWLSSFVILWADPASVFDWFLD
jgi:hypothetical protein